MRVLLLFKQSSSLIACDFTLGPNLQVSVFIMPLLSVAWPDYREVPKGLAFKLGKETKY